MCDIIDTCLNCNKPVRPSALSHAGAVSARILSDASCWFSESTQNANHRKKKGKGNGFI